MKKKIFISFVLLFVTGLGGQTTNAEFRSNWVITWEWTSSSYSVTQGKAKIREILDNMKTANMNAVIFQVRQSGTVYFPSSFEPWGAYIGSSNPGYDPLAYLVEQAHARGMEVHAWFNAFQTSSTAPGTPAYEHPEWICRDQDGNAMDSYRALSPGLDSVRAYTINVAMELVNNYDIDGLHLDYVRWNEYSNSGRSEIPPIEEQIRKLDGMLTEEEIEELNNNRSGRYLYDIDHPYSAGIPDGFSSWEDWWRWGVTTFVSDLHDSIQAVKPWVRLSTAVLGKYNWSGWQGYGSVFQDAALWYNEHYVDQLTPMHYHWTSAMDFNGMLVGNCPNCWSDYIQPGIEAMNLYSVGPGSYVLSDNNAWNNHASIVNACRQIHWVNGFQFFSYGTWELHDYWEEAGSTFFKRRTKEPQNINEYSIAPESPTLSLTSLDSLTYQVTVTPTDTTTKYWTIVYRTDTTVSDSNHDKIISVQLTDSSFQLIDSFTGTQDYNGQYSYYATSANRFWKESSPSNLEISDSIPSFPPTLLSTDPESNDTIRVNTDPTLYFSKTINIENANSKITCDSEIGFSLLWGSDHRNVTVAFYQNLPYAQEINITIDSSLTDINNVEFDGNNDGIPGDGQVIHFITEAEDIWGPEIDELNLDLSGSNPDIEIGEVITIVFDEQILTNTLNGVTLSEGSNAIGFAHQLSTLNEQTIYSIRPSENFAPNQNYILGIDSTIADLLGNPMSDAISVNFSTEPLIYDEILTISNFPDVNDWWAPSGSGSTIGILAGTSFGTSSSVYLPGTSPHKSAKLHYVWDTNADNWLVREYLGGGDPRAVEFDTSYTLQTYLYGDGSSNYFRFCLDDHLPSTAAEYHEVSPWIEINWKGWRLVSWDLGAGETGSWLGNGILEGTLRTDSFQMTYNPGIGVSTGTIYFDNYRAIKKTDQLAVKNDIPVVPSKFVLYQNYPNPFNPKTTIRFDLDKTSAVSLTVYNLMGQEVQKLVDKNLPAGTHVATWSGLDDSGRKVSSGIYFCRLITEDRTAVIRMMLLK